MPVFAYKAADGGAAVVRGTIAAGSPRQARDQLRAQGLVVKEISPQAEAAR
jgi:type II secretory pathway component PulF